MVIGDCWGIFDDGLYVGGGLGATVPWVGCGWGGEVGLGLGFVF